MINEAYKAMLGGKSVIRELSEYATARGAEIGYENVFDYSLGNPSVPCPQDYTDAVIDMYKTAEPVALHGYSPSLGIPSVRKAIAESLNRRFDMDYTADYIFPTTGAAGALAHALRVVTKPGDEVIMPSYTFVSTANAFVLRGAKPVFCDISPDNLNIDASKIEELVTPRTRLELSFNYQDRPYYRRTLTSMTWTYSWSNEKYSSFAVRPVDLNLVDMSYINQDFFEKLQNLYLRNSYTSQLVAGISGSYTYNNQLKNPGRNATLVRFNWETAGNLIGGLEHLFSSPAKGKDYYEIFGIQYSQYFRVDLSASRKIMLGEKAAIAGRLYAGCGLAYGNSTSIPFDRLFYCGGSNGMRGWIPRMLGPGSVPVDPDKVTYPVQLGDMKLEANLEFRFPIWGIFHGATFFDVGNIWFMGNSAEEYPPEAVFHIRDFYKQLGFNTGLGIRLDIKFAVLRLDWGIQLHNPNNPAGKRWIHDFKWSNTALNFGVGYPF